MKKNPWKEFDEWTLAFALYFWLQHNWEGQSDPLYAAFCTLTAPGMFQPGRAATFENLEDEEKEAYELMTRDNYESALEKVLNYKSQD